MVWIPFSIFAASSIAAVISDVVAKCSDDPEVQRKAKAASEIASAVSEISSSAIPLVFKVPPTRVPRV